MRPLLALIQGVWALYPDDALKLLRHRIGLGPEKTRYDECVARVAAKRIREQDAPPEGTFTDLSAWLSDGLQRARDASEALGRPNDGGWEAFVAWCDTLTGDDPPSSLRYQRHRPVGAWLVDAQGMPILAARNTSGRDRTRHAELELLLAWYARERGPLPEGAQIWTSLQSCRMCAAAIVHATDAATPITVRYLHEDSGRLSSDTELQRRGWEQGPFSG